MGIDKKTSIPEDRFEEVQIIETSTLEIGDRVRLKEHREGKNITYFLAITEKKENPSDLSTIIVFNLYSKQVDSQKPTRENSRFYIYDDLKVGQNIRLREMPNSELSYLIPSELAIAKRSDASSNISKEAEVGGSIKPNIQLNPHDGLETGYGYDIPSEPDPLKMRIVGALENIAQLLGKLFRKE